MFLSDIEETHKMPEEFNCTRANVRVLNCLRDQGLQYNTP